MNNDDEKKKVKKVNYKSKAKELEKLDKKNSRDLAEHIRKRDVLITSMLDKQYDMLIEFSSSASEERKKEIQREMLDRQQKMEEMLKEVQNTYEKYEHVANKSTKKAFEAIQETSRNGVNVLWAEMDKRFKGLSDLADELADDMSDSFTKKFSEAAEDIRNFAMQLNIDSIASSLSDNVDNYVETMRDIRRRTGDNFNEDAFQDTVTDIIDSTGTYSRSEAASLVKDVINTSSVRDHEYYRPYLKEISNTTKALGSSFEDMQDIMFIDMSTNKDEKDRGKLMKSINNIVFAMEMNDKLNVDGQVLLRSINENIHDIYGLSEGDSKRQIKMVKSLAVIEGFKNTTYNKGIMHMTDQFAGWMTKSRLELLEDDSFINYLTYTGSTVDEFIKAQQDPEKLTELLTNYAESAAKHESMGETSLHSFAQATGMSDANVKQAALSFKKGEMKEVADSVIKSVREMKGDDVSLAEHQAGKGSGFVEKFWNKVSNNFIVRGISDVFANFDMKLANMANAAIVASKGAELWKEFKQYKINNKAFFDSFKKDGFFKTIKSTEKYQKSMSSGMIKSIKDSKLYRKIFTGDFGKYISKPIGNTLGTFFKKDTYKSLFKGFVDGSKSFWDKFVSGGIGKTLFGKGSEGIISGFFKKVFSGVGKFLGKFLPGYSDIISFGKAMDGATGGKTINALGKTIKPVASFTDKIFNFFGKFAGASKFLKGLPLISVAIDSIFGVFKTKDWFGEGASVGQYIISGITSAIAGSGGGLGSDDGIFGTLMDVVGNGFKGAAAGAVFGPQGAVAGALIGAITAAIGGERIAKAFDWLSDNLFNIPDKFIDGVSTVFSYLKDTTVGWIDSVVEFLKHPIDSLFGSKKEEKKDKSLQTIAQQDSDVSEATLKQFSMSLKSGEFKEISSKYLNNEQLKEWMTKSRLELLEDDSFINYLTHNGSTVDEFIKNRDTITNGDVSEATLKQFSMSLKSGEFKEISSKYLDNEGTLEFLGIIAKNSSEQLKEEKDTTKFAFNNFKKTGLFAKNKKDSIFERIKKSLFGDKETGSTGLFGGIKNSVSSIGNSVSSTLGSIVGNNPAKSSTSNNENQRKIWNFFKEKGMSEAGIAGLMGNLRAESNLESNIVEGGSHANEITLDGKTGYGLAQWTSLDRQQGLFNYAKSKGTSTSDLNTQLEYLWQELNGGYKSVLNRLMNATSVQEASNAVLHDFESPFDQSISVENLRASYGREIQKENANSSLASVVSSTQNTISNNSDKQTELASLQYNVPTLVNPISASNSFVDKQTELASLQYNVPTLTNTGSEVVDNTNVQPSVTPLDNNLQSNSVEDVGKVNNEIIYNNTVPAPETSKDNVVETMKWQVYRLESKLDKLIMVMSGGVQQRRRQTVQGLSETDYAFSSL